MPAILTDGCHNDGEAVQGKQEKEVYVLEELQLHQGRQRIHSAKVEEVIHLVIATVAMVIDANKKACLRGPGSLVMSGSKWMSLV